MTSVALVTVLRAAGRAGVAVCLWGDPGIGKSALIQAAAAADDVPCEIVIGSLREPSDFAGLPVVTEEGVRLEPPSWAKRLHEAKAGYLFLDEWSTSPPAVPSAMPRGGRPAVSGAGSLAPMWRLSSAPGLRSWMRFPRIRLPAVARGRRAARGP